MKPYVLILYFWTLFRFRVNRLIKNQSAETAICFLYLPMPKELRGSDLQNVSYLNSITDLTENLPPTVFVHGVSVVTSTTL